MLFVDERTIVVCRFVASMEFVESIDFFRNARSYVAREESRCGVRTFIGLATLNSLINQALSIVIL